MGLQFVNDESMVLRLRSERSLCEQDADELRVDVNPLNTTIDGAGG